MMILTKDISSPYSHPIGPDKILCNFREDQREELRRFVFRVVRVNGILAYKENSPFPKSVEMMSIEEVSPIQESGHLLNLYGIFGEREKLGDLGEAIDGL